MKTGVLSLVLLFCFLSCQTRTGKRLLDIDSQLNEKPDSALFALNQIGTSDLFKSKDKALYALLKSSALDKNYIDVTNDSLINIAVNYYSNHGKAYNRMRSYYYHGIVKRNAKQYPAAIVSLEKAEKEARSINDLHYLGLIYRNLGSIYNSSSNYAEAKQYTRMAINAFQQNQDALYADYAKYSLAVLFLNEGVHWDSCRVLLNEVRNACVPKSLQEQADIRLAYTYVALQDSLQKAIEIYQSHPVSQFWNIDFGYSALAHAFMGDKESAAKQMEEGYRMAANKIEVSRLHSLLYRVDSLEGNYLLALRKVSEAMSIQDSAFRAHLQESVFTAQRDYYQQESTTQSIRLQKQRVYFTSTSIIFLLTLLIVIMIVQNKRKEQEARWQEQMARLALEQQNILKGNSLLVGTLFIDKLIRLCGLSIQYYSAGDKDEKRIFLQEFIKATKELRYSPDLINGLKDDLNLYCDGVMDKLMAQVPSIKGENRTIISLFFAGIPDKVVQLIMGRISTGSLKTLRSRFRTMIKAANAPDENLFLEMLKK